MIKLNDFVLEEAKKTMSKLPPPPPGYTYRYEFGEPVFTDGDSPTWSVEISVKLVMDYNWL